MYIQEEYILFDLKVNVISEMMKCAVMFSNQNKIHPVSIWELARRKIISQFQFAVTRISNLSSFFSLGVSLSTCFSWFPISSLKKKAGGKVQNKDKEFLTMFFFSQSCSGILDCSPERRHGLVWVHGLVLKHLKRFT